MACSMDVRRCAWLYRYVLSTSDDAACTRSGWNRMSLPMASETPSTVIMRSKDCRSGMMPLSASPRLVAALTMATRLVSAVSGSHAFVNELSTACNRSSGMPFALSCSNSRREASRSCNPARIRSMEEGWKRSFTVMPPIYSAYLTGGDAPCLSALEQCGDVVPDATGDGRVIHRIQVDAVHAMRDQIGDLL